MNSADKGANEYSIPTPLGLMALFKLRSNLKFLMRLYSHATAAIIAAALRDDSMSEMYWGRFIWPNVWLRGGL